MPVSLIQDYQQLNDLSHAWHRLSANPMMSPDWLMTWWRHYGVSGNHRLFVLAVYDVQQQLIGLAPWYLKQHRVFGCTVHALGDGEACSDHVGLVCQRGRRRDVALALSSWLMSTEGTEHARLVQLNNVDADDQTLRRFTIGCASQGALIEERTSASSWHVDLPESWEDYLASLSRNHRKRCRRWDRTFFQNRRVQVHVADCLDDLKQGMEILTRLHSSRRRSLGCSGVFNRQRFQLFHADVMRLMYDSNRLRLSWLLMDDKPIAVEYQLVSGDCVYAYQSGMDATCSEISPGSLSVMASIRWAIENGKRRFDFMRGDEPYKTSWGATCDQTRHLRIRPSQFSDSVRHGVSLATYQTRTWLQRQRQTMRGTLQQWRATGAESAA